MHQCPLLMLKLRCPLFDHNCDYTDIDFMQNNVKVKLDVCLTTYINKRKFFFIFRNCFINMTLKLFRKTEIFFFFFCCFPVVGCWQCHWDSLRRYKCNQLYKNKNNNNSHFGQAVKQSINQCNLTLMSRICDSISCCSFRWAIF